MYNKNIKMNIKKYESGEVKQIFLARNKIGRPVGICAEMLQGVNIKEKYRVKNLETSEMKTPFFYKINLINYEEEGKSILVGPDVFIDPKNLVLYKIRVRVINHKPDVDLFEYDLDPSKTILNIEQEVNYDLSIPIRCQFVTDPQDQCPIDLQVNPDGTSYFIRRWKH